MRKILIEAAGVAAAAAACLVAAPAVAAPTVWVGNGHAYEFFSGALNWNDARAAALALSFNGEQGYLVTITSAAENTFVAGLTQSLGWTGGSDQGTEGNWIWMDGPEAGMAFSYTNWNAGEPNDLGGEDHLHINWALPGGWNDFNGASAHGFIVEYGGLNTAVPEPTTWALLILGFGVVGGALRRSRTIRPALRYV